MTALTTLGMAAALGGCMFGSLSYRYYEDLRDLFPLEFWMYVAGATLMGATLTAGGYFFSNYAAFTH